MLSYGSFQEDQQFSYFKIFKNISIGIFAFSFTFSLIELLARPSYPAIKDELECYNVWYGSLIVGFFNMFVSLGFLFPVMANRYTLDSNKKLKFIFGSHFIQIGSGLWALVTQFSTTSACYIYWTVNSSLSPALWVYVAIHVYLMWFIIGMDCIFVLFWKYGRVD